MDDVYASVDVHSPLQGRRPNRRVASPGVCSPSWPVAQQWPLCWAEREARVEGLSAQSIVGRVKSDVGSVTT